MSTLWIVSTFVLWGIVILLAFLLMGALRQIGLIQLRLGDDPGALITDIGLERGEYAPDWEGIDIDSGKFVKFSDLPAQARVLVFLSPACVACRTLIPHLNEIIDTHSKEFDFRVVCRGDVEACRSFSRAHHLRAPMLVDTSGVVEQLYQVTLTPFTYVLDNKQRVLIRGLANDWRHLESLLEQRGTLEAGRGWSTVSNQEEVPEPVVQESGR